MIVVFFIYQSDPWFWLCLMMVCWIHIEWWNDDWLL